MLLFPGEHAEILVDNEYIMASLGVLSMRFPQAAVRLLEKSLDFKFPKKKDESYQTRYIDELNRVTEEARQKEEEYRRHIEESEAMGYDMSAYKNPEPIGGANKNQDGSPIKAQDKEKDAIQQGEGLQGKWAAQDMGDCNHDCPHCTRAHCPNRKSF
jgi:hypothetical protein